jgi:hypothetical protein
MSKVFCFAGTGLTHGENDHTGESGDELQQAQYKPDQPSPYTLSLHANQGSCDTLVAVGSFSSRSIREHPADPLGFQSPSSSNEEIGEKTEDEGEQGEEEGNEEKRHMRSFQLARQEYEEESGDKQDDGTQRGEEEEG